MVNDTFRQSPSAQSGRYKHARLAPEAGRHSANAWPSSSWLKGEFCVSRLLERLVLWVGLVSVVRLDIFIHVEHRQLGIYLQRPSPIWSAPW